jgi:pantoate--beta-alanine ligase
MKVLTTISAVRSEVHTLRLNAGTQLGLVPTMGALHEGHLSLVRAARATCKHVAVSIFVNPTQFGPNEDLARYPRTLEADCALLENEGVDFVFAPTPAEMYPTGGLSTFVDVGELATRLDGRSRPGHFRGVTTVVSKLFGIITPDLAFFGQKDAAQVAVLRAMVRDLNLPVKLHVCPTVRDADGLALSSRNRYLTPEQRAVALRLPQALACARRNLQAGQRDPKLLINRMQHHLAGPGLRVDYVAVVDADTLLPQTTADEHSLLALAAYVGDTRLIDNLLAHDVIEAQSA